MRRAARALATGLLVAAAAIPALLLAGPPPASASTAQPASTDAASQSQASIAIDGMNPRWATPGSTVTVTGKVHNASQATMHGVAVRLEASGQAVSSLSATCSATGACASITPVARASSGAASTLKPGQSSNFSISFKVKQVGMTAFGDYPLTAVLQLDGVPIGAASTFLPYIPAAHGSKGRLRPVSISWIWPLIDVPFTATPGTAVCSTAQARTLAASLSPGGRLNGLLAAGQSLSRQVQLTWAIDPALLRNVETLTTCPEGPKVAKPALTWLAQLKAATMHEPVVVTPYADVELGLIGRGHDQDVAEAFSLGRQLAGRVLGRDLNPVASSPISGLAWPSEGAVTYGVLGSLAADDDIRSVLLDSAKVPRVPHTASMMPDGVGGSALVLRYSGELSQILSSATSGAGSPFATAQQFTAQTVLLEQRYPSDAIIVAPPQRWRPAAGVAQAVLSETSKAPWLRSAALSSLTSRGVSSGSELPTSISVGFRASVLREMHVIDQNISQLESVQARADPVSNGAVALAALESSAWRGVPRKAQLARLDDLNGYVTRQLHGVVVLATSRDTLGGLKGNVPVSIDNKLGFEVRVQLRITSFTQPPGGGMRMSLDEKGSVLVPAHKVVTIRLRVQAAQEGSSIVRIQLETPTGQPLPSQIKLTVEPTQFGTLAMIILAAALAVFVIASATRALRRRQLAADETGLAGQPDLDEAESGEEAPGPDSVVPEHSELGTAGTSGL